MKNVFIFFLTIQSIYSQGISITNSESTNSGRPDFTSYANGENLINQDNLLGHLGSSKFYGLDIGVNEGDFGFMEFSGPYALNVISNINLGPNVFADDFDGSVLHAIDEGSNTILSIDIQTGEVSNQIPFIGRLSGHLMTGFSYNPVDGNFYTLSNGNLETQLYMLDRSTGEMTPIGNGTGTQAGIWLEIDNNGIAYMADISDENLYEVNLSTGIATLIGSTGLQLNFAQEATIDHATNILYMAASGSGFSQIHQVNVQTGATTFIGDMGDQFLGMFSIVDPSLSVTESTEKSVFQIVPNPSSSIVSILNTEGSEILEISLFDAHSKEILSTGNVDQLDISELQKGLYFLSIRTPKDLLVTKIVKK